MAVKQIDLESIGHVHLYKRRGSRNIRLSVTSEGDIRVTLPPWVPYQTAINFINTKKSWIAAQQQTRLTPLQDGEAIGKFHHLYFQSSTSSNRIRTRIRGTQLIVDIPAMHVIADPEVQRAAKSVSVRALRLEAEKLLPDRLSMLAQVHGLSYGKVSIRQLKSRWGSCNEHHDITLNLFLMQLPWKLIDYVLLHELAHTKNLHHGKAFWTQLEIYAPAAKQLRREIHAYKPSIG